jgi:hypothetical protein
MSDAGTHIAAWEAAGLIDGTTADRLRAADVGEIEPIAGSLIDKRPGTLGGARASTLVGPTVTIAEVFGYLGGAFLLAAWFALIGRTASNAGDPQFVLGIGSGIAAIVLTVLGAALHQGDERRRRGAGVAFLVALMSASAAAVSFAGGTGIEWPLLGVIGSVVALGISIALRGFHPAVLTQIGLLTAFTSLAGSLLVWLQAALFPVDATTDGTFSLGAGPDPFVLVLASAAWWLVCAVLVGLIGLRESRAAERGDDVAAARRAGTSRLWAGLVAIIGLATAVSRSDFLADGSFARVLEPWVGDVALLIVSGVLIERAFRREATSYIYAAALGLIVALSDFNFAYLSDSTETGLFVEGLILLGAGVAADRLRRRVGRPDDPDPTLGEGDFVPLPG